MMRWVVVGWWGFWETLTRLFEDHKLARRGMLVWVLWVMTGVIYRGTQPEVLASMTQPASVFLVAVVGILTTVVGFYVKGREREDRRNGVG